jgi:magnesium transporter
MNSICKQITGNAASGTLSGSMVPFVLKKFNLTPPFLYPFKATLVNTTGLNICFSVAAVFLSGKLL